MHEVCLKGQWGKLEDNTDKITTKNRTRQTSYTMDKTLGWDRDKFEALPKESQTANKDINHVRLYSPHKRILLFYQTMSLTLKTLVSIVIRS